LASAIFLAQFIPFFPPNFPYSFGGLICLAAAGEYFPFWPLPRPFFYSLHRLLLLCHQNSIFPCILPQFPLNVNQFTHPFAPVFLPPKYIRMERQKFFLMSNEGETL
jgi:hypothetical protein